MTQQKTLQASPRAVGILSAGLEWSGRRDVGSTLGRRLMICAPLLALLAGCATNADARKQAEAAFQAGQQQALQQLYESKFPVVTVLGPVRNPKLDWTKELTLARAIIAAGYQGIGDPREIILHRGSEETHITPKELLAGKDWPLQGGDRIELIP